MLLRWINRLFRLGNVARERRSSNSSGDDRAALLSDEGNVVTTSAPGTNHASRTVHSMIHAPADAAECDLANGFLRRLWALLVFQYGVVLFLSSPFALVESFRAGVSPYHDALEWAAMAGIVASLSLALGRGTVYPYAHVALASLTLSVALETGLTFADKPWGRNGIVALGQATTSFAVILGILQFEPKGSSLDWITYPVVAIVCLFLSLVWTLVQVEAGVSWDAAAAISGGGWLFTLLVLFCCSVITKHVAPEEHMLAALFILCPEALVCLPNKERHATQRDDGVPEDVEEGAKGGDYGAV